MTSYTRIDPDNLTEAEKKSADKLYSDIKSNWVDDDNGGHWEYYRPTGSKSSSDD